MKYLNGVFVVIGASLVIYAFSITFWGPTPGPGGPLEIASRPPRAGTGTAAAPVPRMESAPQGSPAAPSAPVAGQAARPSPVSVPEEDEAPSSSATAVPSRPAGVVTGSVQPSAQRQSPRPAATRPNSGFVSTPRTAPRGQAAPQRTAPQRAAPQRSAPSAPPVRGSMSNR